MLTGFVVVTPVVRSNAVSCVVSLAVVVNMILA